jgi:hypothetical protein
MTDKVVRLTTVKPSKPEKDEGLDANLMLTLMEFAAIMETTKAKSFAAVACDESGEIVTTWYSALPHNALIGAVEMLKNDYMMNQWMYDEEEGDWQ